MKKILFIFLVLISCTGCFDYSELNELAIVVGVGLDYQDDKYQITMEILNDTKEGESGGASSKSYVINGEGITVLDAVSNASLKIAKKPYFMHVKIFVLGENVAREKLADATDYVLRSPKLSNEFYSIVAKGSSAEEIFNIKMESPPIISDTLVKMIDNSSEITNVTYPKSFEELLSQALSPGTEMSISTVIINQDGKLELQGNSLFKDQVLKNFLSIDQSITLSTLTNNAKNNIYKLNCSDDVNSFLTISLYDAKTGISAKSKKEIEISVEANSSIVESNCNYEMKDEKVYLKLQKDFEKVIGKSIDDFLEKLRNADTDTLGIGSIYYKKYRIKDLDLWKSIKITKKIKININRKGLTFEVPK